MALLVEEHYWWKNITGGRTWAKQMDGQDHTSKQSSII